MNRQKVLIGILVFVYVLLGVSTIWEFYISIFTLISSLFVYISALLLVIYLGSKKVIGKKSAAILWVTFLSLFVCDMGLRFFNEDLMSYSESAGGPYMSLRNTKPSEYYLMTMDGRENIHTLEFEPYSMRNVGDVYQVIDRPDEKYNALGFRGISRVGQVLSSITPEAMLPKILF